MLIFISWIIGQNYYCRWYLWNIFKSFASKLKHLLARWALEISPIIVFQTFKQFWTIPVSSRTPIGALAVLPAARAFVSERSTARYSSSSAGLLPNFLTINAPGQNRRKRQNDASWNLVQWPTALRTAIQILLPCILVILTTGNTNRMDKK